MRVVDVPIGRRPILCLLLLAVAGCGTKGIREWITPREDDALAREVIAALLREDYGFVIERMDNDVLGDTPEIPLRQLYDHIDHAPIRSLELVGCTILSTSTRRRSDLTYQLEFPGSWYVAGLVVVTEAGRGQVAGFHLQRLPASLAEINRFTVKGKTAAHHGVLLAAFGVSVLVLYALVQCVRTRIKRKWLWLLFILTGIGTVTLNWTTGQLGYKSLSVLVLGAGFGRSGPYSPWTISFAFPLGALLFLRKRRKLRAVALAGARAETRAKDARTEGVTTGGFDTGGCTKDNPEQGGSER
ncbi:MAG: hypothetical protein JW993_04385 [Sedimentisphaerales bacterium]|nr:hypothetical protein [Sedimentisphaerales bacterium]